MGRKSKRAHLSDDEDEDAGRRGSAAPSSRKYAEIVPEDLYAEYASVVREFTREMMVRSGPYQFLCRLGNALVFILFFFDQQPGCLYRLCCGGCRYLFNLISQGRKVVSRFSALFLLSQIIGRVASSPEKQKELESCTSFR